MPRLGALTAFRVALSCVPQAAKPWARLPQLSLARAGVTVLAHAHVTSERCEVLL